MGKYIEPYAKEKNILQLSLFYFGKGRPKKTVSCWMANQTTYRLECNCKYGSPGSFDQDVYTACVRIWVEQGMPGQCIKLNYSDIARELHLIPKHYVGKIKRSLEKLGQARYELKKCFIKVEANEKREEDVHFSLFDTVILHNHEKGKSKKTAYVELYFPDVIRANLEAKYYQFLDLAWYRSLPEGLPRRLYEFLEKKRHLTVNGTFCIAEEAICRWLPITDKHSTQRRKTLEKIAGHLIRSGFLSHYRFDRQRKLCFFSYAQNAKPKLDSVIIESKELMTSPVITDITAFSSEDQQIYLEAQEWLNSIPYLHQKRKHEIFSLPIARLAQVYPEIRAEYERVANSGDRPKPAWVYQRFMDYRHQEKMPVTLTAPPANHQQMEFFVNDEVEPCQEPESDKSESLEVLLDLVREKQRRISQKLETIIKKYYEEQGFDYVKWNILYSNQTATKSYSVYLQKALAGNWAEEWQEEQRADIDRKLEIERQAKLEAEEEQRKNAEMKKAELQKPDFLKRVAELDYAIKEKLWDDAEQSVPASNIRRETNVKIKYAEGLLRHLIGQGENFSTSLLQRLDFGFINQVAEDFLTQIQD